MDPDEQLDVSSLTPLDLFIAGCVLFHKSSGIWTCQACGRGCLLGQPHPIDHKSHYWQMFC